MIVVEGMPGAGKTTLLGRLLSQRVVVFPEAQPETAATEQATVHGLLAQDAARLDAAAVLERSGHVVTSDRCYAGVLAYRHALAATGRTTSAPVQAAQHAVDYLALRQRHASSTIVVLRTDVTTSLARRAGTSPADRQRFAEWFDPDFLAAYAAFFDDPTGWAPPGATMHLLDAGPAATAILAAAVGGAPRPQAHPDGTLVGSGGCCGAPRSARVSVGAARVQLMARALHRATDDGPPQCLRQPHAVAACWRPR